MDADLGVLWAAYRRGAQWFPEGLNAAEFRAALTAELRKWSVAYVLTAQGEMGALTPVGMVTCADDGYRNTPAVTWFPWATTRNKIECCLKWLWEVRKSRVVLFHVKHSERKFWDQLARYGSLRFVGIVKNFFGPDANALYYQGSLLTED